MEIKYKINTRLLILLLVGATMTCTSYLMFVYQPVQIIVRKVATLNPGSIFLNIWSEPPYSVLIDTFIYNISNPEEFLAGREKLRVKQVGPYVYQEFLYNRNATFNENGTMTFQPKRYLKFRKDLSVGDPEQDHIISPNIPLLGITASLQDSGMFTNIAVSSISRALKSPAFLNITVAEYLWGYDDELVTLAHKAIPSWINFERFGILDRLMALDNASNIVTLNLHPERELASPQLTEAERHSLYHIHRWNGSPGLHHWGYVDSKDGDVAPAGNTMCNMVEGAYEGTVFPSHLPENSTLRVYRRAFCRPVPFLYNGRKMTDSGVEGINFVVDDQFLETPDVNPDNACYCVKGKCLPKGMTSISPCYYDIPITLSQPHFYNSDPVLLSKIDGMKPNKTLHTSDFTLHKELGVPIQASLKIQINLDMGETKYNPTTKPFNNMVLPLFWLQLNLGEIPNNVKLLITLMFTVLPILQDMLMYLLGLGGLAMMSVSAFFALFFSKDEPNGRLSFRGEYSPIPIIPMNSPYFKPDLRILK